jgi:predicted Zn finger-like uncharacterized protein
MRITCPNCTAGFDIPSELLGRRGRTLKCATCGHGWFQSAVVDEIDLADVMNNPADKKQDIGGNTSRRTVPDTAAIAAAATQAFSQNFGAQGAPSARVAPPPPATPPQAPRPQPAQQPQPQQPAVPPGARSIMSRRNQQTQPQGGQSMMSAEEAAAALAAQSLLSPEEQVAAQAGQSLIPPDEQAQPAASMAAQDNPLVQGVTGGAPGAPMVHQGGNIVSAAEAAAANPLMEQVAQQPPPDPSAWLQQGDDDDAILGVTGMPGMPGASGMPGAAPASTPPAWTESMMDRGMAAGPNAGAMSQMGQNAQGPGLGARSMLTGAEVQAPGQAARSMLTGQEVGGPGLGAQSMLTGEKIGPGQAGVSQMGGEVDAPGQGSVSLLDGTEHDAQTRQGGADHGLDGVSSGPGGAPKPDGELVEGEGSDSIEDDLFEEGAESEDADIEGGIEGGASGGPGGAPSGKGEGDEEDADDQEDADDEEDEDDLVDPDEDRPDFMSGEDDDIDDLDDDPLAGLEEAPPPKKKPKKKKKTDPAVVTAIVMFIVVAGLISVLYAGRDQLSQLWPALRGVYDALDMEEDPGEGLRLSQPQPSRMIIAGVQTLVVNGFITNLTDGVQPVPGIKLMLVDQNNNIVQETTAEASSNMIDPNSSIPYRIELQLPVDSATGILVEFD